MNSDATASVPIAAATDAAASTVPTTAANPLWNRILFLLSLVGLLVAGYLWYVHVTHADLPCGRYSGCDTVQSSKYSRFPAGTGPPVAVYGALGYLALTALSFLRTLAGSESRDRALLGLMILAAAAGAAFSLYLTYLELFVIHAICLWCVGSQVIILAVLFVAAAEWLLRRSRRRGGSSGAVAAAATSPHH